MSRTRLAVAATVLLMLAGCGRPAPPQATPADGTGAPSAAPAPASGTPALDTPAPGSPAPEPASTQASAPGAPRTVPEALAVPAPGGLKRITIRSGDVASADGVYFLNTSTGVGEAWLYTESASYWGLSVSDDNRFVIANGGGEKGYIIDRTSRNIWRWDPVQVQPLLAHARGFLFAETEPQRDSNFIYTGRFFWTGPDFRPRQTLTLGGAGRDGVRALLSPDGSRVALVRWGTPAGAIFNPETGEHTEFAPPAGAYAEMRLQTGGFQIELLASDPSRGPLTYRTTVRRYDWSGKLLRDQQVPGNYVFTSPDGKWIAWQESAAGGLAPVSVVADAETLRPRLRALGTTPCFQIGSGGNRWLSDSSGLVVSIAGGFRILTLDGDLRAPEAFTDLNWRGEPQPAPDAPDRFAIGRLGVMSDDGAQRVGLSLAGYVTPAMLAPWGATSRELRFALPPPGKGGACDERPPMPALVLKAGEPLPDYPLTAHPAPDRCIELRDRAHGTGRVVGCVPEGTRMAVVPFQGYAPGFTWSDGGWWLSVRTEKGETGWLRQAGANIAWWALDPQPLLDAERITLARNLLTQHLSGYRSTDDLSRLLDFRLDKSSIYPAAGDGRPLVLIEYSVLPATRETTWMAGNGNWDGSGWIVGKTTFIDLIPRGDGYAMQMGTSP